MSNTIRRLDFSDVLLYAVTPEPGTVPDFLNVVASLLKGGVDALQLRTRELNDREFVSLSKEIKRRCEKTGALFLVNNRVDLALATDADGLHLGHEDLPIAFARGLLGHRKVIGVSTHGIPAAIESQKAGADYVSCGPLWATPTKPEYEAVGLNLVGLYKAAIRIPFVAIGSVDETNLNQVLETGAQTVAMVRALFGSKNPEKTARSIRGQILKARGVVPA